VPEFVATLTSCVSLAQDEIALRRLLSDGTASIRHLANKAGCLFAGKTLKPFHDWALQCDLGSKQTDRLPSNMPTNMKMAIVAAVNIVVILVVCSLFTSAQKTQKARTIDVGRSTITIQVFKAGLFSAFGHDHEISAPIQQGAFSEENPSVELSVDARKLRVKDKDVSDKDRAEIQQTMLGPKVLDSERFPQIRFRSTQVESAGTGKWIVNGELTVRGITRPVKAEVHGENGHYLGSAEVRQKDFGITPVSAAGGAVKTKNEMRVEFEVFE
jgi:polyisoprenoid-binding protein YceI